jgi:threonine synthase
MLNKYRGSLPLPENAKIYDLGEGNTPLVKSAGIVNDLFFKMEQLNPTGSFKDRFAALETALIKDAGIKTFIATSSGNTGAALSAYAARYDLKCLLFVNEITPEAKLKQMLTYGAKVFRVKDFGITSELSAPIFARLCELAEDNKVRLVISAYKYSPDGMEGVKTIAYEIVEQLGNVPDVVFVPVGGGGLLSAIWRGFKDLRNIGEIDRLPRMAAVQPKLNDTIVSALEQGFPTANEIATTTSISGLAVQTDIDATRALGSVSESGGFGVAVSDEEIRTTQQRLCETEGIYVEPAGATSVAGYLKANSGGRIAANEKTVCILTGHGLKDTSDSKNDVKRQVFNIDIRSITNELIEAN